MAGDSDIGIKVIADTAGFTGAMGQVNVAVASFKDRCADLNNQLRAVGQSMPTVEAATQKIGFATAGATQEYIRLGHEAMTGNFSRIPGSLIVLASRLGGLGAILSGVTAGMVGWAAAIGVSLYGLYEWIAAIDKLKNTQMTVAGAMDMAGQSLSYNSEQIKKNIDAMRQYQSISNAEAQSIAVDFARSGAALGDLQNKLINYIDAWRQLTGEKNADAAVHNMIKMFSEPAKAAQELADKYPGLISQDDALRISQEQTSLGAQKAAEDLLTIVGPGLQRFGQEYVEPQIGLWERLKRAMDSVGDHPFGGNRSSPGLNVTPPTGSDQIASEEAIKKQQADMADNKAVGEGLAIAKEVHGAESEIVQLKAKRLALENDINAAMRRGDDNSAATMESAQADVDAKILAEQKRLDAAGVAAAKEAQREKMEIAKQDISTTKEIGSINLQTEKDNLQAEVDLGKITKQQELATLKQYAEDEYQINLQALNDEQNIAGLTLAQKHDLYDKIEVLNAQHQQKMAEINQQAAKAEQQEYKKLEETIDQAMDSMLTGVLQGTQTWRQAMTKLFDNLAISFIEMEAKKLVHFIMTQTMMTGAQVAGDVARTTSSMTAAEAGFLAHATMAKSDIGISAGQAAANVYADVSAIPYVGWLLAPPAAAAAFVAVEAFGSGFSASGGFDVPMGVNPMTQLHSQEMVLPANLANNVRNMTEGSSGGNTTVNFNVNAIDSQGVADFFNNNGEYIAAAVNDQIRNGHPALSPNNLSSGRY